MQPPVLCLMGPTGAGKTDVSLALCDAFPCEIISVDSAMVYTGMDIGTAKPSKEELRKVPHHLIDIILPSQAYSVAKFKEEATRAIKSIREKGKIPILVGGTMLYFHALQQGLSPLPSADPFVRQQLGQEALEVGWQVMHDRLNKIDPPSAARISPTDPQRILRALEVYEITKTPLSVLFQEKEPNELSIQYSNIAIAPSSRSILHERIALRFKTMLEQGLIEEVRQFYDDPHINSDQPAMRCVGYRQVWEYLADEIDFNELVDKGIAATRQLAKRQLTWLRKWQNITWLDSLDTQLYQSLSSILKAQLID